MGELKPFSDDIFENDDSDRLRKVLDNESFDLNTLIQGIEKAMIQLSPNCLDVFIKFAVSNCIVLPYILSFSSLFCYGKKNKGRKLVKCTKIFLNNGIHRREDAEESAWQLLYCLAEYSATDQKFDVEFDCLNLLMDNGANPQLQFYPSFKGESTDIISYFHRITKPFCNHICHEFFASSIELFVKNGFDCSETENGSESLFNIYWIKMTSSNSLMSYEVTKFLPSMQKVFGCFIFGGANMNYRNEDGRLILTQFSIDLIETILHEDLATKNDLIRITRTWLEAIYPFLKFMTATNVQEVVKEVLEYVDNNNDQGILTDYRQIFKGSMLKHSCLTLEEISFVKLWNSYGKRFMHCYIPPVLIDRLMGEMLYMNFVSRDS